MAFLSSEEPQQEVIELAKAKLEDGTSVESNSFADGEAVFISPLEEGDEPVALPVGEYKLEDGKVLVVKEEGIIDSIGDVESEEPKEEEVEAEEEVKEEVKELEDKEEVEDEPKEESNEVEELKAVIAALEAELAELRGKQELSTEEVVEETVELSEEVEPIVHIPSTSEPKKSGFYFGKQK
jgi:predicted RNase H-like nuclease (RuvC/YqgF family)